jgi:2-polyprenyl-3-methyl-5-hydroxy-6-metoxy-1,4-benzoquinol methylase
MKVDKKTKKSYDLTYKNGYDKMYPSIEVVRLEKLFFKSKKGSVLDFGCGPGTNGIHFLNNGYKVTFCDISTEALKKVKRKINQIRKKNFSIINFSKSADFFLNKKNYYDYIICFSVLNNLGDEKNIIKYLKFFKSLLRKNGKLIIDSNLKGKHNYKVINKKKNLYTTNPKNNYGLKMYFPTKKKFKNLIENAGFEINDIGRAMFKLFETSEDEVIISATKR